MEWLSSAFNNAEKSGPSIIGSNTGNKADLLSRGGDNNKKQKKGRARRRNIFSPEEKRVGLQQSSKSEFGGLKTPLERHLEEERNKAKDVFVSDPRFSPLPQRIVHSERKQLSNNYSSQFKMKNIVADDDDDSKSNDSSIMNKSFHMMGGSVTSSISSCDGSRTGDRSPFIIDDSDSIYSESSENSRIGITPPLYHNPSDEHLSSLVYPQSPLNLFMSSPSQNKSNIKNSYTTTTPKTSSTSISGNSSSRSINSSFSSKLLPLQEESERYDDVVSNALAASMSQKEYERSSKVINEALALTCAPDNCIRRTPVEIKQDSDKLRKKKNKITRFIHKITADRYRRDIKRSNSTPTHQPHPSKESSRNHSEYNVKDEGRYSYSSINHSTNTRNMHNLGVGGSTAKLGRSSPSEEKESHIGISPCVTPELLRSGSSDMKVFVLVILPSARLFELIQVTYDPYETNIGHVLEHISANCTEEKLASQVHIGLCRPRGDNDAMTDLLMKASGKSRDGSCRIQQGEILVAIPQGYEPKQCQLLAQQILKNPALLKLLSKANPLSKSEKKRRQRSRNNPSTDSLLGISSRNMQYLSSLSSPVQTIEEEDTPNDEIEKAVVSHQRGCDTNADGNVDDDPQHNINDNHEQQHQRSDLHFDENKFDNYDAIEQLKLEAINAALKEAEETYKKTMLVNLKDLNVSDEDKNKIMNEIPPFYCKMLKLTS